MKTTYLPSKPRYEILDGLRGVAALIVVIYHLCETYANDGAASVFLPNHGYLAVDFFFVLSGFVIGYAYDDRWDRMSLWSFFKRRLIRLHPMVIMGTLIGAALFYFGESNAFPLIENTTWNTLLFITLLGCLMIPTPPSWDIRGWGETNSLNGPTWSLLWEYLANILYALIIRRFSRLILGVFVALSALLTLDVALNIDTFGLLGQRPGLECTLVGGWSLTPQQLYIGITRLFYPFFAGLLLSRMHWTLRVRRGFYWCSLAIIVVLAMPYLDSETPSMANGLYQTFSVLVLFPIIVSLGAGSEVTGKRSIALCRFFGEISYPLYITHFPLIYMQIAWAESHPDAPTSTHIFLGASIFFLAIAIAYACLRLYDEPLRKWLRKRFA